MSIRVYDEYNASLINRELAAGDAASVADTGSVWIRNDDGDVEEVSPSDHPAFVTDGCVYAWHPDEGTADDAARAGQFGHILDIYFTYYFDEWIWLGRASSAEEGLDLLRDRLGVLDPAWIYLAD